MNCWISAKKILVREEGFDDEEEFEEFEDEGVDVNLMVGDHETSDVISIDTHGEEHLTFDVAIRLGEAIRDVIAWSYTPEGKRTIASVRRKHRLIETNAKKNRVKAASARKKTG